MYIVTLPTEEIVEKTGNEESPNYEISKSWKNFFEQQQSNMQKSLSDEGFWVPSISSASTSVTPNAAGGQVAQLEATFFQPGSTTVRSANGLNPGTIIFDPNETNGGSGNFPLLGQLKVLLADGIFHPITNT